MVKRVAVIGNSAGGKTLLSRKIGALLKIPITHIDSIQFVAGMKIRALDETRAILKGITSQEMWLIDGFGPLDLLEPRLKLAERIVFVDLPIWRHYWWCLKRQIKSLVVTRAELPAGCNEATWSHSRKMFQTLWKVHTQMRPELLRILARPEFKAKVVHIQNVREWQKISKLGLA